MKKILVICFLCFLSACDNRDSVKVTGDFVSDDLKYTIMKKEQCLEEINKERFAKDIASICIDRISYEKSIDEKLDLETRWEYNQQIEALFEEEVVRKFM